MNSNDSIEGSFDSLLFSHVLEHLEFYDGVEIVKTYLKYLKAGGQIIFITPQEAGFESDESHLVFFDFKKTESLCSLLNLRIDRQYSFPFPRFVGRLFRHNEFIVKAYFSS